MWNCFGKLNYKKYYCVKQSDATDCAAACLCDIGWGDPIPDDTTLVVFRWRLGQEKFRELFSRLVEEAKKKGCLKGQWAIIDGTKVIADVAQRGVIALLREARKKIHRELEKHRPELAKELSAQAEPLLENDFANQEELLAGEAIKTKIVAEAVKDVAEVSELVRQVEEILGGGQASLADPDARAGYQKKDDPFFGYKAVVTVNEKGLVEAVEVGSGNVNESTRLEGQLEQLEAMGIEHTRLAADKGYASKSNREHALRHGMKPYIPERKRGKEEPKFEYDRFQDKLVCPAGKRSMAKTPNGNRDIFTFSVKDCRNCPYASRCLGKSQKARQVYWVIDPAKRKPKGMKLAENPESG
ncbi:MAG: transposase [Firmicutes bacterium]|nr:transposase [Bacillota bacterium]